MAVIAASCFLLLCNLPPTLVLWSAVVEEVFSGLINDHYLNCAERAQHTLPVLLKDQRTPSARNAAGV
ncbi:hypothetical protein F0170_24270 [Pseudomonas sp. MAFF 730085]|uniref:Uncharacterized protein n=1 Tax=Pseudomonas kitaguniensis TaxID=2607908 RepID=A0A5N7JZM4_9PSED|nr:hypothetical protein [Pseudomonas kitaguniensis]